MSVRAKFTCIGVSLDAYENKNVSFLPVVSGSEENKSFSKYTPSGSLQLNISPETSAYDYFEQDKEYYLDLSKAFAEEIIADQQPESAQDDADSANSGTSADIENEKAAD